MKVSRTTPWEDTPPFNNLFDPIRAVVDSIFQQRLPLEVDGSDDDLYVRIRKIEEDLMAFAASASADVAFVVGPKGIGKSSVLRYLYRFPWRNAKCRILSRDLSADRLQLRQRSLGNASNVDDYAQNIADDLLSQVLYEDNTQGGFQQQYVEKQSSAFRDFVRRFLAGRIPPSAQSDSLTDDEFRAVLGQHHLTFAQVVLCYRLHLEGTRHVKIILDNTDDEDLAVVGAISDGLARIQRFVDLYSSRERQIVKDAPVRRVTPILACRPVMYSQLHERHTTRPGGEWYGIKPFTIKQPAPLFPVLLKRYNAFVKSLRGESQRNSDPIEVTSQREAARKEIESKEVIVSIGSSNWVVGNCDTFYKRVFAVFERQPQVSELQQICNFNMAQSIVAALQVLRNRHFVNVQAVFSTVKTKSTREILEDDGPDLQRIFTSTTVLRALAYGNQGNKRHPQYPIAKTRVPHLLTTRGTHKRLSLFKPWVVALFARTIASEANSLDATCFAATDLAEWGREYFGLAHDDAWRVIDDLFVNEILENSHSSAKPSECGSRCLLHLTQRGWVLWTHLGANSVLLECYCDELDLDNVIEFAGMRKEMTDQATRSLDVTARAERVVWLIVQFWQAEQKQINGLVERRIYGEFSQRFGDVPVARYLLSGFEESDRRYYARVEGYERDRVAKVSEELKREMELVMRSSSRRLI